MNFGKCLFIYNPISGPDSKRIPFEVIKSKLETSKIEFLPIVTQYAGHATDYLRENHKKFDTLICSGGDGSINEIINAIPEADYPALLLIPQGTGNDLNKSLYSEVAHKITKILEFDNYKRTVLIDVGKVSGNCGEKTLFTRKFCNAVGIGMDSLIAKHVSELKKRNNFSYIIALLNALFEYKPMKCSIDALNLSYNDFYTLISVQNGKTTGGGFYLAPDAIMDDSKLDVCLIENISKIKVIFNFIKVLQNKTKDINEIKLMQSDSIKVKLEKPFYVHIDGEMAPGLVDDVSFSIIKERLKFHLL